MKMITRCPACATTFRIYREQLDARGGKVRCGYCAVVFDAHHDLSVEPEMPDGLDLSTPAPFEPAENSAEAAASDASTEGFAVAPDEFAADEFMSDEFMSDEFTIAPGEEVVRDLLLPRAPTEASTEDFAFPTASIEADPAQAFNTMADSLPDASADEEGDAIAAPIEAPSIEEQAQSDASLEELGFAPPPVRPRWERALWGLLALVLGVLLGGQLTYFYRDQLVAWVPQTQPWLAAACERLGCSVPSPQRADLISIESSELQIEPNVPDVLTLSAVLRNRAPFTQAYPALELTLTNESNLTVARRVLQPKDYLAESSRLGKPFDAGSEASFKLHIDAAGLGASGYRLYVFNL